MDGFEGEVLRVHYGNISGYERRQTEKAILVSIKENEYSRPTKVQTDIQLIDCQHEDVWKSSLETPPLPSPSSSVMGLFFIIPLFNEYIGNYFNETHYVCQLQLAC